MSRVATTETGTRDDPEGHMPPDWPTVLRAQLRLLARKQWKVLGLLAAGAALVTFLGLTEGTAADLLELLLGSPLYALAFLLAIGWAAGVWSDEGPGERAYHWSLPVSRPAHDLTRVGLGGLSYLAVGAVGLAVGSLAFAVLGGTPALGGGSEWVLLALGLLTGFLLGTVPALVSEHPLRWAVGIWFGYLILAGLAEEAAEAWGWGWLGGIEVALKSIWLGSHGLRAAFLAPGQVAGYSEQAAGAEPVAALLLWLGLAAATVVGVSFLHVERAKGAAE